MLIVAAVFELLQFLYGRRFHGYTVCKADNVAKRYIIRINRMPRQHKGTGITGWTRTVSANADTIACRYIAHINIPGTEEGATDFIMDYGNL